MIKNNKIQTIQKCLYTYILTPNTVKQDGILSPIMVSRDKLQHYAERVNSWKTSEIIKWLEKSFTGRSKSISVLTEKIPSNIKRQYLIKFTQESDLYELPSLEKLQALGLVKKIYMSMPGNEKFIQVKNINYDKINWPTDKTKWGFTGIRYYQLVLTKGYIPAKYCKKISQYDPPYDLETIKKLYGEDSKFVKNILSGKDEVHKWRAENGIELIHREPALDEQIRIWYNWNNMSDEQKKKSDEKCKEINHGLTNHEIHNIIMMEYDTDHKIINSLINEYNKRDMISNNIKYIHLSLSSKPLIMHPRVPKNTMKCEDKKIKRICFSTSILQATGAIKMKDVMYVHVPDQEPKYIISTDEIKDRVQDAPSTGEVWILDEVVKTKVIGKIQILHGWSDNRFDYPIWNTDKEGINHCSYVSDYTFEYFKPIAKIACDNYAYYPITKNDANCGYVDYTLEEDFDDKLLHTSLESLIKFLKNNGIYSSFVGFIKIPISKIDLKTDDFYFKVFKIDHKNDEATYMFEKKPYYNFSFNKSDIRNFKKESKFDEIFNSIINENNYMMFSNQFDKTINNNIQIKIANNSDELNKIVLMYYDEYYKNHENKRQIIKIGESESEDHSTYVKLSKSYNFLSEDLKEFAYSKNEFNNFNSNPNITYIVALNDGHLVGCLKYWHKSSNNFPCIGFIDVNKHYKHQGVGTILLDYIFTYHQEKHPNTPLLFTDFSEEGQQFVKPIAIKLSQKYNVDISTSNDIRHYYENMIFKQSQYYSNENEYEYEYDLKIPESIKKYINNKV